METNDIVQDPLMFPTETTDHNLFADVDEPQEEAVMTAAPDALGYDFTGTDSGEIDVDPLSAVPPHTNESHIETLASYGQLLAPPSYSDSVLLDKGEIQPDSLPSEDFPATRACPLEITVSDPVKRVEGGVIPGVAGGYVTYKVHTKTQLPAFKAPEVMVRRRFRDFVDLSDLLAHTHRGYFIPPRPEKNVVEGQRMTKDFIEARRAALEKYLAKLVAHPVICQSAELRVFLECDGELSISPEWNALKPAQSSVLEGVAKLPKQIIGNDRVAVTPAEASQSAKSSNDFMRMFKEFKTQIAPDARTTVHALPTSEEEGILKNENAQIVEFEVKLTDTTRKAEHLVKRLEDVGNVLGDIGLSFIKVAKFEDEDGLRCGQYTESGAACKSIASDSRRIGMAAVRLSRLSRTATVQTAIQLSQLHDYLALLPAVRWAMRERDSARVTVATIEAELDDKQKRVGALEEQSSKIFGGDKNRTRKISELQHTVSALEAAKDAANAEYDRVKSRNISEIARYKTEKTEDFMGMLVGFARVQAAFAERSFNVWLGVAEEFGIAADVANKLTLN
mmetsp:Transcript_17683/g.49470  ORF Transcript_17683/g.49470 Transcript_17683/m.49470 type:complete len:564 (-) Transcript_17683:1848-3539(-)|eukprot:CAMPEP_0117663138 /NCGR_PEP_ID=MMETSP0804-20121206/8431_1 /TAXON_ID=1074897 /ORGANISM="Tetraselmis astigmatica, Strain CCMP880" /LENGTH=563 /DNA_ID=CAMNT_0005470093 /DNA_START=214 /DNA_END=1905 /DNA_ORIENTATION=+